MNWSFLKKSFSIYNNHYTSVPMFVVERNPAEQACQSFPQLLELQLTFIKPVNVENVLKPLQLFHERPSTRVRPNDMPCSHHTVERLQSNPILYSQTFTWSCICTSRSCEVHIVISSLFNTMHQAMSQLWLKVHKLYVRNEQMFLCLMSCLTYHIQ